MLVRGRGAGGPQGGPYFANEALQYYKKIYPSHQQREINAWRTLGAELSAKVQTRMNRAGLEAEVIKTCIALNTLLAKASKKIEPNSTSIVTHDRQDDNAEFIALTRTGLGVHDNVKGHFNKLTAMRMIVVAKLADPAVNPLEASSMFFMSAKKRCDATGMPYPLQTSGEIIWLLTKGCLEMEQYEAAAYNLTGDEKNGADSFRIVDLVDGREEQAVTQYDVCLRVCGWLAGTGHMVKFLDTIVVLMDTSVGYQLRNLWSDKARDFFTRHRHAIIVVFCVHPLPVPLHNSLHLPLPLPLPLPIPLPLPLPPPHSSSCSLHM